MKALGVDANAMFYRSGKLPQVILAEMKHHFVCVVLSKKGTCSPSIVRNRPIWTEIAAATSAHIGRFATRAADRKRCGTSALNGRCYRQRIVVI